MCREKHCESSSWLGNSARWFVVHEHVNIHILLSLLWDCVHTAVCEKCLVRIEESVFTTGGLYRPTHLCVAHFELHKKFHTVFFFGVVRLGGGGLEGGSGGRGLHGVSEGGGDLSSGLSQPGGKSCWAVWWLWCSGTVFLMVGAGRDCGRDGWGPSWCCWFCWSIVQGKCPGWMGEGHRWSLQLCSLSAVGSCGLLHYSSRTRQWCSWSAHSQWCP